MKEQTADCAQNSACSDTDGGYTCICKSGFKRNRKISTVNIKTMCWIIVKHIIFLSLSV